MIEIYEKRMTPIRDDFFRVTTRLYRTGRGDTLHLFLINHCALGVGMTDMVSSWIKRAGERCLHLGYPELGKVLIAHAGHEAGHEQYMINDTRSLVDEWNRTHEKKLNAPKILRQPYTPGVVAYRKLHEACIRSNAAYAQIAIEYEIEKISVDFGAPLIRHCARELGTEILEKLSFVQEHVALDVGHTAYNRKALNAFLVKHPKTLDQLVRAGARALETYGRYLADCMKLAIGVQPQPSPKK